MAYLGKTPSQAVRSRYYFTASGGETSLSGTDDNGNTLTYTDGNYVDVSLNGVALVAGSDYNTTTANTIGGLTALTASDVVEVVVYDTFSVFSGNVNSDFSVGGDLTITGTTTTSGNINFGDNDKAIFGAGSDLQIYHDGSNSFIKDAGPGSLQLHVSGLDVLNAAAGEFIIRAAEDGSVDLYHDNSKKLETTSTGIDVTGTVTADGILNNNKSEFFASEAALVSTGSTAKVYATNSTFDGVNGSLVLQSRPTSGADVYIATGSTPKTVAKFNDGGDISFYDSTGVTQGLFWDASTQRLGLGTTGPGAGLEVEDANGIIVSRSGYSQYLQLQPANNSVPTILGEGGNGVHLGPTSTTGIRVNSSGQVLINATSTASATKLHVKNNNYLISCNNNGGTSGFFGQIQFLNNADNSTVGSIIRTNDASVSYNTTSDARLKENVADMTGGIAKVKQLAPKRFSWIAEDLDAADQDGFLAHEAQAVVPGCATGTQNEVDDDGNPVYMQMDAAKLVPVLTAALKEAITKIEALETSNADLIARIETLENA